METRQSEKSVESRDEGQAPPALQPDRKPRFQIVKLDERIAPGGGHGIGSNFSCSGHYTCHRCGS